MSAADHTVPASSGFTFWTLVRIAGIIVGIATLLRVATTEGLVTYDPLFQQWMDRLRDFVELGFLTDLIGPLLNRGIEWVRSFGIVVPDLQDEWRPAFVFSMLMFGAVARHSPGWWLFLSMLMFGAVARHSPGWWLFLAAPAGALAIAVWSGLTGSLAPVAVAFVVAFVVASAFYAAVFAAVFAF